MVHFIILEHKDKTDNVRAPRFIQPIRPQTVPEEEVVILEAIVESSPLCSFQWFHDNIPIKVNR